MSVCMFVYLSILVESCWGKWLKNYPYSCTSKDNLQQTYIRLIILVKLYLGVIFASKLFYAARIENIVKKPLMY